MRRSVTAAGINVQHIPFRGPVEAFTEVMTGRIDFYYLPIAPALPNIRDGPLAIENKKGRVESGTARPRSGWNRN